MRESVYVAGNTPIFIHKGGGEGIGSKGERTAFYCGGLKRMTPYAYYIRESSVPSQSLRAGRGGMDFLEEACHWGQPLGM